MSGRFNRRVPLCRPNCHWHEVSCTEAEDGDCASPDDAADPGSTYRRPICAVLSIGIHVVAVSKSAQAKPSPDLGSARLRLTPHSGHRQVVPTVAACASRLPLLRWALEKHFPHRNALLLVHRGHEGAASAMPVSMRLQLDRGQQNRNSVVMCALAGYQRRNIKPTSNSNTTSSSLILNDSSFGGGCEGSVSSPMICSADRLFDAVSEYAGGSHACIR